MMTREERNAYENQPHRKAIHAAYEKTPGRRAQKFFRQYGITYQQREKFYQAQAESCAICRKPVAFRAMHTDHNHKTGAYRGLLCRMCNHALGMFQDDPQILDAAAAYLRAEYPLPTLQPTIIEAKRPCKHCGSTQRYASNRSCVPCKVGKMRKVREAGNWFAGWELEPAGDCRHTIKQ